MTINTEWLWTPFDQQVDGNIKHQRDMTKTDYLAEINFYINLINSRHIDVVALSEIENRQVAEELARGLGESWRVYFKQGRDTATGQDVAIISKLIYVEGSLTDFGFPSGYIAGTGKSKRLSKVVGAQFFYPKDDLNAQTKQKFGVITSHFLSKRNETKHKANNRLKQSIALTKAVDEFRKSTDALIVLGDFNDQLKSETIRILIDHGLKSFKQCDNFLNAIEDKENKRWFRNIDHVFFAGLKCKGQYKVDLHKYSDHDAIYAEFNSLQAK